jgi:hypothetical protein
MLKLTIAAAILVSGADARKLLQYVPWRAALCRAVAVVPLCGVPPKRQAPCRVEPGTPCSLLAPFPRLQQPDAAPSSRSLHLPQASREGERAAASCSPPTLVGQTAWGVAPHLFVDQTLVEALVRRRAQLCRSASAPHATSTRGCAWRPRLLAPLLLQHPVPSLHRSRLTRHLLQGPPYAAGPCDHRRGKQR